MTSPTPITDPTLIKALDSLGNYDNPQVDILCGDWHNQQPQFALPTISNRVVTLRLNGNQAYSEIAFNLLGPDKSKIQTRISDIWYNRNGIEVCRTRVKSVVSERSDTSYGLSVASEDYRSILTENRIFQRDLMWKVATPVEQILLDVINHTQQQSGGNLGIVRADDFPGLGTNAVSGITAGGAGVQMITAKKGSFVGEFINTLSRLRGEADDQPIFDWDIDSDLKIHMWVPTRGVKVDSAKAILSYPGNITGYQVQDGGDGFANELILTGGEPSTLQVTAILNGTNTAPEGRWELPFTDSNLITDALVKSTAPALLQRASIKIPTYTVTLAANSWRGPSHFMVGDFVALSINDTYEKAAVQVRITEMRISYSQENVETVEVTLSKPVATFRNLLRNYNAKLRKI